MGARFIFSREQVDVTIRGFLSVPSDVAIGQSWTGEHGYTYTLNECIGSSPQIWVTNGHDSAYVASLKTYEPVNNPNSNDVDLITLDTLEGIQSLKNHSSVSIVDMSEKGLDLSAFGNNVDHTDLTGMQNEVQTDVVVSSLISTEHVSQTDTDTSHTVQIHDTDSTYIHTDSTADDQLLVQMHILQNHNS